MPESGVIVPCPILDLPADQVRLDLRGFPDTAIAASLALRDEFSGKQVEACLYGLFLFYLPRGTEVAKEMPSGPLLLREDLGLDSLALSEAMFKIEELFGIRVEHGEIAGITTLTEASHLLFEKLHKELPPPLDE